MHRKNRKMFERHAPIEPLDARCLLAASISGTTLNVLGTDAADDVRLDVDPVFINLLRVRINGVAQDFLLGDYTTINVQALGGNDRIELGDLAGGHPASMVVDAGPGNDDVIGSPYADRLAGGTGNDSIRGNAGNDTLHGDAGDDTLKGDAGDDQVNGDDGEDRLSDNNGLKNLLKGGRGSDRIEFTNTSVGIGYGGEGIDDLIAPAHFGAPAGMEAYNAQATLVGDAGDDRLRGVEMHGGDGVDHFSPVYYRVSIFGDGGDDVIDLKGQIGYFDGGSGNDRITFAGGTAMGGTGDDRITETNASQSGVAADSHSLAGGDGDDTLHGSDTADHLEGGDGQDMLYGGAGNDTIRGGSGDDELRGEDGNDDLYGDSGNDRLYGGTPKGQRGALIAANPLGSPGDRAFGGKGSDWIDPNSAWAFIEDDPKDVKTGASVSYGSVVNFGGTGGLTLTSGIGLFPSIGVANDVRSDWSMNFASAAIFAGVNTQQPTSAQLAAVHVPNVSESAAKAVKASVLHLPVDWRLTPRAETNGGLAWFGVTRAGKSYGLADGPTVTTVRTSIGGTLSSATVETRNAITVLGVSAGTLLLLDSPANEPATSKWVPTTGWRTTALVTRPGTIGRLPGVATPITFARPGTIALPTVPAGKRALYTLGGLILIDDEGAHLQ